MSKCPLCGSSLHYEQSSQTSVTFLLCEHYPDCHGAMTCEVMTALESLKASDRFSESAYGARPSRIGDLLPEVITKAIARCRFRTGGREAVEQYRTEVLGDEHGKV